MKSDQLIQLHIEAAQSLVDAKRAKTLIERNTQLNKYADCRTMIEGIHPKKAMEPETILVPVFNLKQMAHG